LAALRRDLLVRFRQRINIDATIWTPMSAMKGHRYRPLRQELVEPDQVAGVVGQNERGHFLARPRRRITDAVLAKPLHQTTGCGGKVGPDLSCRRGEVPQLLAQ